MKQWDPYDESDPDNQPAGTAKEWPAEGVVDYENLVNPVLKIMLANYKRRHNTYKTVDHEGDRRRFKTYKNVVYDGYNIGKSERATIPDPANNLNPAGLRYHELRDRELMHVLVNIVFCLGMEQGRRDCAERNHRMIEIAAECRARGESWPPDPATPEEMKAVGESIQELLKYTSKKRVTKSKNKRRNKRK